MSAERAVRFSQPAVGDLRRLDPPVRRRIQEKLQQLQEGAEEIRLEPLRARLAGLLKLRVGEWRVVLERREAELVVLAVAHRREVYRIAGRRSER